MTTARRRTVPRRRSREAIDKSLRRLQTDYIDLYQMHLPDRPMPWGVEPDHLSQAARSDHPIEETLDVLGDLVKAGKIRHVGLSNESAWGTMTFLRHAEARGRPRVQSVQNAYSLLNRTYEMAWRRSRCARGSRCSPIRPGQGYLTGKYLTAPGLPARARPSSSAASATEAGRGEGDPSLCRPGPRPRPRPGADGIAFVNVAALRRPPTIIGATAMEPAQDRHRRGRRQDHARDRGPHRRHPRDELQPLPVRQAERIALLIVGG